MISRIYLKVSDLTLLAQTSLDCMLTFYLVESIEQYICSLQYNALYQYLEMYLQHYPGTCSEGVKKTSGSHCIQCRALRQLLGLEDKAKLEAMYCCEGGLTGRRRNKLRQSGNKD